MSYSINSLKMANIGDHTTRSLDSGSCRAGSLGLRA